jgi:hypothetical protein
MNFLCELTFCTFSVIGALAVGALIGWLGGFVHGIYWRGK